MRRTIAARVGLALRYTKTGWGNALTTAIARAQRSFPSPQRCLGPTTSPLVLLWQEIADRVPLMFVLLGTCCLVFGMVGSSMISLPPQGSLAQGQCNRLKNFWRARAGFRGQIDKVSCSVLAPTAVRTKCCCRVLWVAASRRLRLLLRCL